MQWRRIGLAAAAGLLLLVGGCDASASMQTGEASAAVSSKEQGSEATAATESAAVSPSADDAGSELRTPALADMTVYVMGTISELDPAEHMATIAEGADTSDPSMMVTALITDSTLIVDAVSGRPVTEQDLKTGELTSAALSPKMTRSVPPQAEAYALITGEPENGVGVANYLRALDVMTAENGDTVILNENADLYVTIPADLTIESLDGGQAVPTSDIRVGSELIVWYDTVAESYPAQTTATRAVFAR